MAKGIHKRWWVVLLAVIGVLAVGGAIYVAVCTALVRQDNIREKYTLTETDDSFLWSALKASLTGAAFDATEAQVNTYLYRTFCGADKPMENVRVYFHQQEPCEIYAKIHYHNQAYALSALVETTFDSSESVVGVSVKEVKLGEWPVPSWRVSGILQDFADHYEQMHYTDGVLFVSCRYTYDFKDFGFRLQLEEFTPQEGYLRCRTNSLSKELLNALKDYLLSDNGQDLFTRLFGERTNALKNLVLQYLR